MAFRLIWLPDVLRSAGLKVAVQDGWENRGHGDVGPTKGVMWHHTAGPATGNMPSLKTLINGSHRPDGSFLPGPLAQLGLGRDGTYYVIAAGLCNHAGPGSWNGLTTGNTNLIGIEAENMGTKADPWPQVQLDAYVHGTAAILAHVGASAEMCCGHKEWRPTGKKAKIDPLTLNMYDYRAKVRAVMEKSAAPLALVPHEAVAGQRTLHRGLKGDDVKTLQSRLGVAADGDFGGRTEAAVRQFQRDHGLVPDGIVGPKTWQALPPAA